MSFSGDVKEELAGVIPGENHCRIAELAALLRLYGKVEKNPKPRILLSADNPHALRKCFTLLNKTFNISADAFGDLSKFEKGSVIELNEENAGISRVFEKINFNDPMSLLKKDCCKRAYLRGAFIADGFINDPNKGYHFEILAESQDYTKLLTYLLSLYNITPKCSVRKKHYILYLKDADAICDVLNILGAHKSMMDMANARILRNVRNSINRRNNCDTANITKAVNAAGKQIEDILLIQNTVGLDALPDSLKQMAEVRLENPESSFTELGNLLNPPVGKSGVNHRLRKLSEYAESVRSEREKT